MKNVRSVPESESVGFPILSANECPPMMKAPRPLSFMAFKARMVIKCSNFLTTKPSNSIFGIDPKGELT